MRIDKLETTVNLECDECGKQTRRLYMIQGDIAGEVDGFCLMVCKQCFSILRLKLEKAIDRFKYERKRRSAIKRMQNQVDVEALKLIGPTDT